MDREDISSYDTTGGLCLGWYPPLPTFWHAASDQPPEEELAEATMMFRNNLEAFAGIPRNRHITRNYANFKTSLFLDSLPEKCEFSRGNFTGKKRMRCYENALSYCLASMARPRHIDANFINMVAAMCEGREAFTPRTQHVVGLSGQATVAPELIPVAAADLLDTLQFREQEASASHLLHLCRQAALWMGRMSIIHALKDGVDNMAFMVITVSAILSQYSLGPLLFGNLFRRCIELGAAENPPSYELLARWLLEAVYSNMRNAAVVLDLIS